MHCDLMVKEQFFFLRIVNTPEILDHVCVCEPNPTPENTKPGDGMMDIEMREMAGWTIV